MGLVEGISLQNHCKVRVISLGSLQITQEGEILSDSLSEIVATVSLDINTI
jgi:hypothetical protein